MAGFECGFLILLIFLDVERKQKMESVSVLNLAEINFFKCNVKRGPRNEIF